MRGPTRIPTPAPIRAAANIAGDTCEGHGSGFFDCALGQASGIAGHIGPHPDVNVGAQWMAQQVLHQQVLHQQALQQQALQQQALQQRMAPAMVAQLQQLQQLQALQQQQHQHQQFGAAAWLDSSPIRVREHVFVGHGSVYAEAGGEPAPKRTRFRRTNAEIAAGVSTEEARLARGAIASGGGGGSARQ